MEDDPRSPAWLSQLQVAPASLPTGTTRPAPLLFDDQHRPISSPERWRDRREALRRAWLEYLGQIAAPRVAPALRVLEEEQIEPVGGEFPVARRRVGYEAEAGLPVEGYLLRPWGKCDRSSLPGVVVLHSTVDHTIRQPAGLEGPDDLHLALQLARRGYAAFCPRNFLWEYGEPKRHEKAVDWLRLRHPRVRGMAKMLFDSMRGVDVLASLPEVDHRRLGAIGHSLGGKEVLYLAALDDRIRAAVSSEGGIGLSYSNWEAPWYLGDDIHRPGFALDHGQLLSLVAPRGFLLVGGDSADGAWSWPYIEAAMPVWKLLDAPDLVGLLNHHMGHSFPPPARGRAYDWLDWALGR